MVRPEGWQALWRPILYRCVRVLRPVLSFRPFNVTGRSFVFSILVHPIYIFSSGRFYLPLLEINYSYPSDSLPSSRASTTVRPPPPPWLLAAATLGPRCLCRAPPQRLPPLRPLAPLPQLLLGCASRRRGWCCTGLRHCRPALSYLRRPPQPPLSEKKPPPFCRKC
jgi:hypothetical protein